MKKERIIPRRRKCDCGKIVKNHHWLCDECWKEKNPIKKTEANKNMTKYLRRKYKGEDLIKS